MTIRKRCILASSVKETKSHKAVRLAIVRIEKGKPKAVDTNRKLSVAAVAEEADVERNIIYRDCPDLLERIKGGVNKGVRQQISVKQEELNKFKERNKELRSEVGELRTINAYLQSKNAALIDENMRMEKQKAKHDNVVQLR
ncbi:TetR family transcriptional regulator [Psychromonas sp. PRT-SC03]|nr:TetR family transcriptional regulator [Psychromonas sp. PRT-SC03]